MTGQADTGFPTVTPIQPANGGGLDGFVAKISFGPTIAISPLSIDFGTVYLGTITTKKVTITNTGTSALTIKDPFISIVEGGNSREFVQVSLCPKSLAVGKNCTITISFVAGPFYTPQTASLSIMDNAPGSPQTVGLTALVIDPQASINPCSLSFGTEKVNTSASKTVTLENTGATSLNLTGLTVVGANASDFTESSNCTSSLTAGSSCMISVTFKPTGKGSRSATLKITDNARSATQTELLSGVGK